MILQGDVHRAQRVPNLQRDPEVIHGGAGIPAGVVVRQDHRVRLMPQRIGDHLARIQRRLADGALGQHLAGEHRLVHVQADDHNGLHLLPRKERRAELPRLLPAEEAGPFPPAVALIDRKDADQRGEQRRRVFADAGHLHQLLRPRVQHAGQGAEMLDQLVGQGIDVPPRDGVHQEELQHLVRLEAAHIGFPHPLAHPFPVAVVLCHVLRLLVGGRSLSPGGAERVRPAADGRTRSSILFSLFSAKKRGAA